MRSACLVVAIQMFALSVCMAAEHSWVGVIGDSVCAAQHESELPTGKLSEADCIGACIKKGAKYVFVSDGKVYRIENQDFAGLQQHAGQKVRLRGELNADSIQVSRIANVKEHRGEKSSLD
jgi:hypothetical protein